MMGPDLYYRLLCANGERTAQQSPILSAFAFIPLAFCHQLCRCGCQSLISGDIYRRSLSSSNNQCRFPGFKRADPCCFSCSAYVLNGYLPAQSVILTEDIVKRVYPVLDERKTVLLARVSLVGLGLAAFGLALVLKGVISSLLFTYTIFTCGLAVPVIAGFYKKSYR